MILKLKDIFKPLDLTTKIHLIVDAEIHSTQLLPYSGTTSFLVYFALDSARKTVKESS